MKLILHIKTQTGSETQEFDNFNDVIEAANFIIQRQSELIASNAGIIKFEWFDPGAGS